MPIDEFDKIRAPTGGIDDPDASMHLHTTAQSSTDPPRIRIPEHEAPSRSTAAAIRVAAQHLRPDIVLTSESESEESARAATAPASHFDW